MIKKISTLIIISLIAFHTSGESLWNDKAGDIYSKKIFYRVGDSVQIILNESTNLEYKSNSKALKTYKINFSGKNISGVTDILPQGSIEENKSSQDSDKIKINTAMQARVTAIGNDYIRIRGTKDLLLNNKQGRIEISGDAFLSDMKGNSIDSGKLVDSRLSFSSLTDNINDIMTLNDLSGDSPGNITITDRKKKELLLQSFNKILNVIFR